MFRQVLYLLRSKATVHHEVVSDVVDVYLQMLQSFGADVTFCNQDIDECDTFISHTLRFVFHGRSVVFRRLTASSCGPGAQLVFLEGVDATAELLDVRLLAIKKAHCFLSLPDVAHDDLELIADR